MRIVSGLFVCAILSTGCRSTGPEGSSRSITPTPAKGGNLAPVTPPAPAPATNTVAAAPVILPVSGRVHSVNAGLRFVVIDYTLGGMPPMQSLLNVYRQDEKVGELRLSGPDQNGFAAADIIDGFIQVEDEVRIH